VLFLLYCVCVSVGGIIGWRIYVWVMWPNEKR
jgi:hypothetical protein